jgi:hypothetical protein
MAFSTILRGREIFKEGSGESLALNRKESYLQMLYFLTKWWG